MFTYSHRVLGQRRDQQLLGLGLGIGAHAVGAAGAAGGSAFADGAAHRGLTATRLLSADRAADLVTRRRFLVRRPDGALLSKEMGL